MGDGETHERQYVLFTKWSVGELSILIRCRVDGLVPSASADAAAAAAHGVSLPTAPNPLGAAAAR